VIFLHSSVHNWLQKKTGTVFTFLQFSHSVKPS
jgi:hypothetical protein